MKCLSFKIFKLILCMISPLKWYLKLEVLYNIEFCFGFGFDFPNANFFLLDNYLNFSWESPSLMLWKLISVLCILKFIEKIYMPSSNGLQLSVHIYDDFKDISNKICSLINFKINLKRYKTKIMWIVISKESILYINDIGP